MYNHSAFSLFTVRLFAILAYVFKVAYVIDDRKENMH